MDIIKVSSICICVVIAAVIVRKFDKDYSVITISFAGLAVCIFSVLLLSPVIEYIKQLCENESYSGVYSIMLKGSGISFLTALTSEMCRDLGEAGLASKIEFAGKCTVIVLCLPLIKQVFEYAKMFI